MFCLMICELSAADLVGSLLAGKLLSLQSPLRKSKPYVLVILSVRSTEINMLTVILLLMGKVQLRPLLLQRCQHRLHALCSMYRGKLSL